MVLGLNSCSNASNVQMEHIHPPTGLVIIDMGSYHEIQFTSDNTEDAFSGYAFFQAADMQTAKDRIYINGVEIEDTATADGYCTFQINVTNYMNLIKVQAGGADVGLNCYLSALTLTSGNYLAVRAFVDRSCEGIEDCTKWSTAAVAQVP